MNDRINAVVKAFYEEYPDVRGGLEHERDPFRLLVMAILSAQCTDKQVNAISKALFERFPDAQSIADSELGELEKYRYSAGFYNTKAKSIRKCCKTLIEDFDGKIPCEMEKPA